MNASRHTIPIHPYVYCSAILYPKTLFKLLWRVREGLRFINLFANSVFWYGVQDVTRARAFSCEERCGYLSFPAEHVPSGYMQGTGFNIHIPEYSNGAPLLSGQAGNRRCRMVGAVQAMSRAGRSPARGGGPRWHAQANRLFGDAYKDHYEADSEGRFREALLSALRCLS